MYKKINTYYLSHLFELPAEKQFHYASRMWLWTGKQEYAALLKELRTFFAGDLSLSAIDKEMAEILANQTPEFGSKNAFTERKPYFDQYPLLRQTLPLLFRLLFIETIYGVDTRKLLENHVDIQEIEELSSKLMRDSDAIALLSTHAVNFFYLWSRFYKQDEDGIPVQLLFDIGQTRYDHSNKTHLQLLIYLYTHCIIGESLFYKRRLPARNKSIYERMCKELDKLISDKFESINLDNKCEFLVACKIAGYTSDLQTPIYDEAKKSFSAEGDFIIDRHNLNPQSDNTSFEKSEHRNVLLVMSANAFTPIDQVVG